MNLLYFAWVRQKVGCSGEHLDLPAGVATVRGLAEHLAHRGVDADEMAVRMGQRHADGGVLERTEETLFAFVQPKLQRTPERRQSVGETIA